MSRQRQPSDRKRKAPGSLNGYVGFHGETAEEAEWNAKFKASLEAAGYKVTMLNPKQAIEWKKARRRKDREMIERRLATPEEIQRKNSLFTDAARSARIIDYGGLDEEA